MILTKELIGTSPVSVHEVKKQLNIDTTFSEDDNYISTLIDAAIDYIKGDISADIITTKNTITIESPELSTIFYSAPFITLVEVLDGDLNDVTSEFTASDDWSSVIFTSETSYDKLSFEFTTGYTTLPAALRQAIILQAAALYDEMRNTAIIGTSFVPIPIIPALVRSEKRRYW
jgi:hypothetical protein